MRKRISRPSPALVISLVALFVALGGTGYAAIRITGKNVKNSSLTGKDIKNNSLTGSDIKNNSLTGSDVKESRLGTVPRAANGVQAYGYVSSAGVVDPARSKGITAKLLSTAIYCVTAPGVSNAGRVPVVTPVRGDGGGTLNSIQYVTGAVVKPGCETGWEFLTKSEPNNNNNLAFSIVIP